MAGHIATEPNQIDGCLVLDRIQFLDEVRYVLDPLSTQLLLDDLNNRAIGSVEVNADRAGIRRNLLDLLGQRILMGHGAGNFFLPLHPSHSHRSVAARLDFLELAAGRNKTDLSFQRNDQPNRPGNRKSVQTGEKSQRVGTHRHQNIDTVSLHCCTSTIDPVAVIRIGR